MNSYSNYFHRLKNGSRLFLLLLPVIFNACRKTKVDNPYPLTGVQVAGSSPSSVRLFNFYNATLDVKANNVPLTAFSSSSVQGNQIGLSLFPSGAWSSGDDGSPVTMPVSLFDKNGQLHIIIQSRGVQGYQGLPDIPMLRVDTVLSNDPLHPKDYYVMGGGYLKVIDRNITAPSQADHFKLRIMNFGQPKDTLGLTGPVVLTYADGTPVKELDTVGVGKTSPYVELPYGSYQFKLYVAKASGEPDYTKQLAELPVYPNFSNGGNTPQQDLVTRVRGFKPGGTYTMMVTPNVLGYNFSTNGESPTFFLINSYRVLTEQAAPQNISWARIQAVNAWQDQSVSFRLDGMTISGGLGLGQSGDYSAVIQGAHHLEAVDGSGNTIAAGDIVLYPYDNITAWVFARGGKAAIAFTNTDMTSTLYESMSNYTVDDGTDGSKNTWHFNYAIQTRFLNLSDVPYVTFTKDGVLFNPYVSGNLINQGQNDTVAYPQAYINLQPGVPVVYNPFVVFPSLEGGWLMKLNGQTYIEGGGSNNIGLAQSDPLPIRVFQSSPQDGVYEGQVPGALLGNVTPLKEKDFASGTLIYPDSNLRAENGFYTVALIGNALGNSGPAGKLIVVKHNK
ncbi:MAG: hypothetical protein BGO55_10845 [Sphingobacteriales bacterium 50-39]|nr:hypothetical protein [Sphingobacteriales bacterium]OJW54202.1 MAG: hypothetical protein BGO55_10845 [Sphingobacteriales bacterium 50-39]